MTTHSLFLSALVTFTSHKLGKSAIYTFELAVHCFVTEWLGILSYLATIFFFEIKFWDEYS